MGEGDPNIERPLQFLAPLGKKCGGGGPAGRAFDWNCGQVLTVKRSISLTP